MPPYPCCVVDPEYPADDVLLQVGRDKLHLDGSVAVDSVFWPVLWAQLNKTGTYTHTHTFTHAEKQVHQHTHTLTKQRKANKENKGHERRFISFRI